MPDEIKPDAAGIKSASIASQSPRNPTAAEMAVKFSMDPEFAENPTPAHTPKGVVKIDPVDEPNRTIEPEHVDAPPKSNVKVESKKVESDGKPATLDDPTLKPIVPVKPVAAATAQKGVIEPIVPKGVEKKEFDYTGFNEGEVTILKNMSVQSREAVVKVLKENKELSKLKDGQYLQNPNAYTLDPQYTALQDDVFYYNKEAQHWQEQLIKIKNGEKWSGIQSWDKQGNPVYGPEQVPTHQAEEQARLMLNRCITATEGKQGELKQFAGKYKDRITNDSKAIRNEREVRFGWVKDPELLKGEVEIEPGLVKTVKDIREDLISLFPPYMRNTDAVEVAADLFVSLQIYGQEIRSLKAGGNIQAAIEEEKLKVEPSSKNGNTDTTGAVKGSPKKFTLAGMPT